MSLCTHHAILRPDRSLNPKPLKPQTLKRKPCYPKPVNPKLGPNLTLGAATLRQFVVAPNLIPNPHFRVEGLPIGSKVVPCWDYLIEFYL